MELNTKGLKIPAVLLVVPVLTLGLLTNGIVPALAQEGQAAPAETVEEAAEVEEVSEVEVETPDESVTELVEEEMAEDELLSLDFKDADIRSVFRILSIKGDVNIVATPAVEASVNIRLTNVTWRKALDVIVRTYGLSYEEEGNIIRVYSRQELTEEIEEAKLDSVVFKLNYIAVADEDDETALEDALSNALSDRGKIQTIPSTNSVVVTDVPSSLRAVEKIVEELDTKPAQVYIDSKIIETALGKNEDLGIDWNVVGSIIGSSRPITFPFPTQTSGFFGDAVRQFLPEMAGATTATTTTTSGGAAVTDNTFRTLPPATDMRGWPRPEPLIENQTFRLGTLDFTKFSAVLKLLKSRDNTKIISNPRVVTLNHKEAMIQVGEEVYVPEYERNETTGSFEVSGYDQRDTGIVLHVTPHITTARDILVNVIPEISGLKGGPIPISSNKEFQQFAPVFSKRSAETNVLVESGDTIAIGGLMKENDRTVKKEVPWFARIPIIGYAFKNQQISASKAETIFFVTVTIVDNVVKKFIYNQSKQKVENFDKERLEWMKFHKDKDKDKDQG